MKENLFDYLPDSSVPCMNPDSAVLNLSKTLCMHKFEVVASGGRGVLCQFNHLGKLWLINGLGPGQFCN